MEGVFKSEKSVKPVLSFVNKHTSLPFVQLAQVLIQWHNQTWASCTNGREVCLLTVYKILITVVIYFNYIGCQYRILADLPYAM